MARMADVFGMFKTDLLLKSDEEYTTRYWMSRATESGVENYALRRYCEALEDRNPQLLNSWLQQKCYRQAKEIKRLRDKYEPEE